MKKKKTKGRAAKDHGRIREHRLRQATISKILKRLYGPLAKCNPKFWEQRTYLLLIGLLYTRLVGKEKRISTNELERLAKMLAEQRRANASSAAKSPESVPSSTVWPAGGEPQSSLADVVREVYGVQLQS